MLFKTLDNKTNTPPTDLSDDERWVAETYLPELWQQYREATDPRGADEAAVEVVREILLVAESFGARQFQAILAQSPFDTVLQLIEMLLKLLAPGLDWSPPSEVLELIT